jgi:hypothetical protein
VFGLAAQGVVTLINGVRKMLMTNRAHAPDSAQ